MLPFNIVNLQFSNVTVPSFDKSLKNCTLYVEDRLSDLHLTLLSKENSSSYNFLHSLGTKQGNNG